MTLALLPTLAPLQAKDQPPRAVIEDSYIMVPRQAGEYTLLESHNYGDEGQPGEGVGLHYRDPLLPTLSVDIFVYPEGDMALEQSERNFRGGVEQAVQRGIYRSVQWQPTSGFTLKAGEGGAPWQGQLIPMTVVRQTGEYASRTYLFRQGLYTYKARFDLPLAQQAMLPPAADAMVRAILPLLRVVSVGSCGRQQQINIFKGNEPIPAEFVDGVSADGFQIAIREADLETPARASSTAVLDSPLVTRTLLAAQRQQATGCTSFPFDPRENEQTAILKLHYPADFWQAH